MAVLLDWRAASRMVASVVLLVATGRTAYADWHWADVGGGTDEGVETLTVFDGGTGAELIATGRFHRAEAVTALNMASWEGVRWSALPFGPMRWGEGTMALLAGRLGTGNSTAVTGWQHVRVSGQRRTMAYLDGLQAKVDRLKALQAQTAAELDALLPAIHDRVFRGEL